MKIKINYKLLLVLISGLILYGCLFEIGGDIKFIYKLPSPKNDKFIYTCFIESPVSFTSGNIETSIINSNKKYNPRKRGNLSGYTILGWVGPDTLKVIKFHKRRETEIKIPSSKLHQVEKFGDIFLDISHLTSFGGGKGWFNFDSLSFTRDSIYFFQLDSIGEIKKKLGLLKGQIRLEANKDTVTKLIGNYYERIEKHFPKITKGNEMGYPYTEGTDCDIIPNYKLQSSIFDNHCILFSLEIKGFK